MNLLAARASQTDSRHPSVSLASAVGSLRARRNHFLLRLFTPSAL